MSLEEELAELSTLYHGSHEYIAELEKGMVDCNKKIAKLEQITEALFEIAPAGSTRNWLWRKYQALKRKEQHGK